MNRQAYFQQHPEIAAPLPAERLASFGRPEIFVPQKVRAKSRFLIVATVAALGAILSTGYLLSR
jgi:hypothetical protein